MRTCVFEETLLQLRGAVCLWGRLWWSMTRSDEINRETDEAAAAVVEIARRLVQIADNPRCKKTTG